MRGICGIIFNKWQWIRIATLDNPLIVVFMGFNDHIKRLCDQNINGVWCYCSCLLLPFFLYYCLLLWNYKSNHRFLTYQCGHGTLQYTRIHISKCLLILGDVPSQKNILYSFCHFRNFNPTWILITKCVRKTRLNITLSKYLQNLTLITSNSPKPREYFFQYLSLHYRFKVSEQFFFNQRKYEIYHNKYSNYRDYYNSNFAP